MSLGTINLIALLMALPAAVLAFIFIIPDKKRAGMGKLGQLLHDFCTFKFVIIEKFLHFLTTFTTAFCLLCGFFMLFWVDNSGWGDATWKGYYGLLVMVLGPILARVAHEFSMLIVLGIKNLIQINQKLKDQNEGDERLDIFQLPSLTKEAPATRQTAPAVPVNAAVPAPQAAPAPVANLCPHCGAPKNPGAVFCAFCGKQ